MVRHVPLRRSPKAYEVFFGQQAGHGLPVFIGSRSQRGRGLGSFLSGIGRMILPIFKTGGKALLREGALTGLQVAKDALDGRNISSSFKQHARESGKRLLHGAVDHLAGNQTGSGLGAPPGEPARKRIKRQAQRLRSQSKKRRRPANKNSKKSKRRKRKSKKTFSL